MICKSHDIYARISDTMSQKLDIEGERDNKEKIISEYQNALLEYTYCKMMEMGVSKKENIADFEVMLEKFSDRFTDEKERDFFYQQFGHSIINMIAFLEGVGGITWWTEDKEEGMEYPHFSKKEYNQGGKKSTYVDFHSSKDEPMKDTVIWLYQFLSKEYVKGIEYVKKETN